MEEKVKKKAYEERDILAVSSNKNKKEKLISFINQAWRSIDQDKPKIRRYMESLPLRLAQVVKNKGEQITKGQYKKLKTVSD